MSDLESGLPQPFLDALRCLREKKDAEARVDAISDNFAYVWMGKLAKNNGSEPTGGWLRLPLAFPHANPHGLITCEALKRAAEGEVADAHHVGHDMCKPVAALGAAHYYSWTWENSPPPRAPEDIMGVVQWYERRIRKG